MPSPNATATSELPVLQEKPAPAPQEQARLTGQVRQSLHAVRLRLPVWLMAIRDAYVALLPLTILGAMATTLAYNPYADRMNALWGPGWQQLAMLVSSATMGVMGLMGAMAISYKTSVAIRGVEATDKREMLTICAIAGAGFLLVVLDHEPDFRALGYASVLRSILTGIACAELMHLFLRWHPHGVDISTLENGISLPRSLHLCLMASVTLGSLLLMRWLLTNLLALLSAPLQDSLGPWLQSLELHALWLNSALVIVNQLLWTIGINGGQFILHLAAEGSPLISPATLPYAVNAASPSFLNAFAHLGGAGATWGLILFCVMRSSDPAIRRLAWVSVIPAVLNVNEPLLFGIPLVFGRAMALPFVLAPLASCLVASLAIHGLGMTLDGQAVVWSTPVLLSGYLMSESWKGVAVQAVCLVVSAAIYAPFVRRLEAWRVQRSTDTLQSALQAFSANDTIIIAPMTKRADAVGDVARCLVHDLALDLNTARVRLFYQPQHDGDGRVVGLEALLRWTHQRHGPIPTQAIINIAEECDLIHAIGAWVVNQACQDIAALRYAGYQGFKVSINMSALQLESPHWVSVVRDAIARHQVGSNVLDIEITEGRTLSNSVQAEQTLQGLQAMDISLSMDDFGMGCTSLLYMHRFRIHMIKLDGVLTRHVLSNPVDRDIIRCVCELGHSQGLKIVAEYVESDAQKAMLQSLGCDIFQGWLYSAARPLPELPGYLNQWGTGAATP